MPRTKSSNSIDKHVGSRIRMRRLMLDMNQTKAWRRLGDYISAGSQIREGRRTELGRADCITSPKSYRSRQHFFSKTTCPPGAIQNT